MTSSPSTNLLQPLQTELAQFQGKRIFFEPLEGNNGDNLIGMGGLELLRRVGVKFVRSPHQAEAIVVNGGAGMTDIWGHGFKVLKNYNQHYSSIPLIVLPSSFIFSKTDFPTLFRERTSPAFIYTRERYSLKILEDLNFPGDVRLGIDDDMAFYLKDAAYIQKLRAKTAQKHILIVERNDPESVTNNRQSQQTTKPSSSWKRQIPPAIKMTIKRQLLWRMKRRAVGKNIAEMDLQSPFTQEWQKQILEDYPNLQDLPVCAADISDPEICSFDRFGQLIAEAAVVVTTRLHVGILAAMLDKPTYLKSGSYHKIRGIFEYSLADKDNVWLI